jgi:hypothetical protein
VFADRGTFEILVQASGPRTIFTTSRQAGINNDWHTVCVLFHFCDEFSYLTASFLDFPENHTDDGMNLA